MGMGFPISRRVMINIVLVEYNTMIQFQIKRPEPCNLSTTTPLVINRVIKLVDLVKKASLCLRNEEHKQKLESTQLKIWVKLQMYD